MLKELEDVIDAMRRMRPRPKPVFIDAETVRKIKAQSSSDGHPIPTAERLMLFGLPLWKWGDGYLMGTAEEIIEAMNDKTSNREMINKLV